MKRSTKSRKVNKFSKTMDPPTFLGGRQLKDFQKVTLLISSFSFLLFFSSQNGRGSSRSNDETILTLYRKGFCGSHFVGIRREAHCWQMKWGWVKQFRYALNVS